MASRVEGLRERYRRSDVEFGLWEDVPVPLRFGDGTGEYDAIRQRVGLVDYSGEGTVRIAGHESKEFLQSVLTRDIEYLDVGRSKMTLLLDEEGRIVGDGTLYGLDEDEYLLETWGAQRGRVRHWIERQAAAFDVTVAEADLAILAVEGPEAWRVIEGLVDFDIMGLRYQAFRPRTRGGDDVLVARTGYTAEYGYKLFVPGPAAAELWQALLDAGRAFGIRPCGIAAIELCMLEVRFPCLDKELLPGVTPWEAALNWMVDFRKENTLGRKGLLERRVRGIRRLLVCFEADGEAAVPGGTAVTVEDERVGVVARTEWSPALGKWIGVAYLDYDLAVAGLELALDGPGAAPRAMRTVSAPFIVPQSWRVAGAPR